jgi:hypothetical protein
VYLGELTTPELLEQAHRDSGNRTFLVGNAARFTFAQTYEEVVRIAAGLETVRGEVELTRFTDDVLRGEFTITSAGPSHWRMILAHTAQLDRQVIRANSELRLALSGGPMLDDFAGIWWPGGN